MTSDSGPTSGRSNEASIAPHGHGLTLLALSFAGGIAACHHAAPALKWPWLLLAAAALGAAGLMRRPGRRTTLGLLIVAAFGVGGAWCAVTLSYAARGDMASQIGNGSRLVHVRGVAQGAPSRRDRTAGSMGQFDYRPISVYFPMRVEALIGSDGRERATRGEIYVNVGETVPPFDAGDGIEVTGFLSTPSAPANPGEFDYRFLARALGQAGTMSVPSRDLLVVTPAKRLGVHAGFLNWRDDLRRRASGWLLSSLPYDPTGQRDALLAALLLGKREMQYDDLTDAFRRIGLAHLLAISGLHLGVLAGFVLLLLRLFGVPARRHGWLIIIVVLGYLVLVEVRMPVLRAGVMTIASSVALIMGRRLRVSGLVALSAIVLLAWRPDQLFTAGFQLSFGVVLGIVHLAPGLRRRWFGQPDMVASSTLEMLGQWLRTTVAVTAAAWLVATPIVAFHFGVISPMAIPVSVVALPLVAVLLALGYLKMILALLLPSAALLLGLPLSVSADVLLSMIDAIDALPFSALHVPYPSACWTAAALGWVIAFALVRARAWRRWVWAGLPIVAGWLVVQGPHSDAALRIDMLAVGDGSCYVVRSDGRAALFDAGSSTDLDAGRKVIVPALRRLGVRSIDFIAISHANLDHYSAVLEIADEFEVDTVLVTPHLVAEARDGEAPSAAYLLDRLAGRFVRVEMIVAGGRRRLGDASLTWLHPDAGDSFRLPNDTSMVIRIESPGTRGGPGAAALLCGDIQEDAITKLLAAQEAGAITLKADVLELPHHGSFNDAAVVLVDAVDPAVVLQSTGYRRWAGDRWAAALGTRRRLVTARDGACSVRLDGEGGIGVERFGRGRGGR